MQERWHEYLQMYTTRFCRLSQIACLRRSIVADNAKCDGCIYCAKSQLISWQDRVAVTSGLQHCQTSCSTQHCLQSRLQHSLGLISDCLAWMLILGPISDSLASMLNCELAESYLLYFCCPDLSSSKQLLHFPRLQAWQMSAAFIVKRYPGAGFDHQDIHMAACLEEMLLF